METFGQQQAFPSGTYDIDIELPEPYACYGQITP